MGTSAGGLKALKRILSVLPTDFPVPIAVVQHISPQSRNLSVAHLNSNCLLEVIECEDKEPLSAGMVYIAPPNYHLLIEKDRSIGLSVDPKVNFSRPSIDVLFETAAEVFTDELAAVVLTGANNDGTAGSLKIKEYGGIVIVQDPATAESEMMPGSVIESAGADYILPLCEIGPFLNVLVKGKTDGC